MSDTASPGVALRCPTRHWGFALDAAGVLDVRCTGQRCKTAAGLSVVHQFDLSTGSFRTRPDPSIPRQRVATQEGHHGRNTDSGHR